MSNLLSTRTTWWRIWHHIAQHNLEAADRVVVAIESTIETLSQFPGIGTPCPHLAPGLRRTSWREYLIYYRISEKDGGDRAHAAWTSQHHSQPVRGLSIQGERNARPVS
ncbi:MAG: type II toxin-antitoxin system RelE/ParE family toxin [Hyphomonadaceae bacterium]|nr:type II toxin-antitoxin system RelE/ParE family toxin [Hyphomonadaceae bacterium]